MSPPGNLHASTLVRLRATDPPAPTLALVAAVALHEALSAVAPGLSIKWPNDVVAGGAKVAGILLERHGDAVVAGFGANLAAAPELADRAATSLAALAGVAPDPQVVLDALAAAFARRLGEWRGAGLAAIVSQWTASAHPRGAPLTARLPDGEAIDGTFDGLAGDGALRLRLADGGVRAIHAGDVFPLKA